MSLCVELFSFHIYLYLFGTENKQLVRSIAIIAARKVHNREITGEWNLILTDKAAWVCCVYSCKQSME